MGPRERMMWPQRRGGHATSQKHFRASGAANAPAFRPRQAPREPPVLAGLGWAAAFCVHALLWGLVGPGPEPGPPLSSRRTRTCLAGGVTMEEEPEPQLKVWLAVRPEASHSDTGPCTTPQTCELRTLTTTRLMRVGRMTMEALCHGRRGWLKVKGGLLSQRSCD